MLYQTPNLHGGDVYSQPIRLDFSANINPYGTPPAVLAALQQALTKVYCYPDPYCRALVEAIAAHEGVPQDCILCGNGAAELIRSYCEAVKPKTALELAPTFAEYALGLERQGCIVERYPLLREREFLLDERILDAIRRRQPEVLFLRNPNNPTGRLIPPELLTRILHLCGELNIRMFLDECFLDLTGNGESMKSLIAECPQLFLLKAFTKSYGIAGIRLGYGICAEATLLSRMADTVQPWNVSLPAQAAGVAALGENAFVERARELIAVERGRMREALERLGFWVCPSDANFLLFSGEAEMDVQLRRKGIAVRNCDNFYGLSSGWYRVAVRLPAENEALIRAIAEACGRERKRADHSA